MEARFSDIVAAYEMDKKCPYSFRSMHKVTDNHLQPVMQYTMKVSVAAQVLSHTVGAYLYSMASVGALDQRVIATATFLNHMDTLFDSFNGRAAAPPGKILKCAVTEGSPHLEYWKQAFEKVKTWRFQRRTKAEGIKLSKPPSPIGWLTSLNAVRGIWTHLHKTENLHSLRPRSLLLSLVPSYKRTHGLIYSLDSDVTTARKAYHSFTKKYRRLHGRGGKRISMPIWYPRFESWPRRKNFPAAILWSLRRKHWKQTPVYLFLTTRE
ncbi:hypothetical protein HUJ04_011146 [Dendroctonus ponderosae]|nr:hypothetical protein HUJ04_011146 [Dendroctonus ponderosae]